MQVKTNFSRPSPKTVMIKWRNFLRANPKYVSLKTLKV